MQIILLYTNNSKLGVVRSPQLLYTTVLYNAIPHKLYSVFFVTKIMRKGRKARLGSLSWDSTYVIKKESRTSISKPEWRMKEGIRKWKLERVEDEHTMVCVCVCLVLSALLHRTIPTCLSSCLLRSPCSKLHGFYKPFLLSSSSYQSLCAVHYCSTLWHCFSAICTCRHIYVYDACTMYVLVHKRVRIWGDIAFLFPGFRTRSLQIYINYGTKSHHCKVLLCDHESEIDGFVNIYPAIGQLSAFEWL